MTAIYNKYSSQGLEILAFPCNQFNGQEPGTDAQIKEFATKTHGAQYPMFTKADVNGANAQEVYKYLRRNSELYDAQKQVAGEIPWNFAKFLVDKDGKVVKYFGPQTEPETILPEITKML